MRLFSGLLIFLFLEIADSAPGPCCMPSQWSAVMTNLRDLSYEGKASALYSYDSDRNMTSMWSIQPDPDHPDMIEYGEKVVVNFTSSVEYHILPNGSCTWVPLGCQDFLDPCFAERGESLGAMPFKDGESDDFTTWRAQIGDARYLVGLSESDCHPIFMTIVGRFGGAPVEWFGLFTHFKPHLPDEALNAFETTSCNSG